MDRKTLMKYKKNKRELALIDKALFRLQEQLENVPVVSGKVTKSGDEFPYIEGHMTVQMAEPKAATTIKDKIREKENRRTVIVSEMNAVEQFIQRIPEGEEHEIFEMSFLDGMKQWEIADTLDMERSNVSKKIAGYLKLSHNSHFNML